MGFGVNLDISTPVNQLFGLTDTPGEAAQRSVETEAASLRQRVALARELGIHPSVLLGAQSSASAPVMIDGGAGVTAQWTREHGLSDADKKIKDADVRTASANADLAEVQAALAKIELANINAPSRPANKLGIATQAAVAARSSLPIDNVGTSGVGGLHGGQSTSLVDIQSDKVTAPSPQNYGRTAGVHSLYTKTVGLDGKEIYVPNPDLNIDPEQLGDLITLAGNLGVDLGAAMVIYGLSKAAPAAAAIGGGIYGAFRIRKALKAASLARRKEAQKSYYRDVVRGKGGG